MIVKGVHHVAYRCQNAKRTADFYTKALGLKFSMAMSEERVPTTGAECPYMHIFFQMGDGSHVAFFDLANERPMELDPNTPPWVQHLALEVENNEALEQAAQRLRDYGVNVIGPIDHSIFVSIYFHDPDGHRVELTYRTETTEAMQKLFDIKDGMLEEWTQNKRVSSQAAWVHQDLRK